MITQKAQEDELTHVQIEANLQSVLDKNKDETETKAPHGTPRQESDDKGQGTTRSSKSGN